MPPRLLRMIACAAALALAGPPAAAQDLAAPSSPDSTRPSARAAAVVTAGYVIGTDDVLAITFWGEKEMSGDVIVRPDGRITVPQVNDIVAAGLTPDQLRVRLNEEARRARVLEDPVASVVVKQINSLRVFIVGEVPKPGPYSLTTPLTVLQLIAVAGGLAPYAAKDRILVLRTVNGTQVSYVFDYEAVTRRSKLQQNIRLEPGDTVLVP